MWVKVNGLNIAGDEKEVLSFAPKDKEHWHIDVPLTMEYRCVAELALLPRHC